jgi:hypothetical protein
MEAKELMIGDWVEFTSKYGYGKGQIAGIEPREGSAEPTTFTIIKMDEQGNTRLYVGVSKVCVRPIPLTAEILEKNGFSDKYAYDDLSYAADAGGDIIGVHIIGQRGVMDEMYFDYVHELQHALRLCGIEKTIEIMI